MQTFCRNPLASLLLIESSAEFYKTRENSRNFTIPMMTTASSLSVRYCSSLVASFQVVLLFGVIYHHHHHHQQQQQQQQGTNNHWDPVLLLCFYLILQTKTVAPCVVLPPPLQQPICNPWSLFLLNCTNNGWGPVCCSDPPPSNNPSTNKDWGPLCCSDPPPSTTLLQRQLTR